MIKLIMQLMSSKASVGGGCDYKETAQAGSGANELIVPRGWRAGAGWRAASWVCAHLPPPAALLRGKVTFLQHHLPRTLKAAPPVGWVRPGENSPVWGLVAEGVLTHVDALGLFPKCSTTG